MSSRHPEELQDLAEELGPLAQAGTPREAAASVTWCWCLYWSAAELREERAYLVRLSDEQRRRTGCPASELCDELRTQDTRKSPPSGSDRPRAPQADELKFGDHGYRYRLHDDEGAPERIRLKPAEGQREDAFNGP